MTITQLIQGKPATVNEFFAKLATTTNGAVKSRDSVLAQLKAELEQQAKLEEDHLFPVLRKHSETRDLVRAALDDNKQMRTLLAELEAMPKDGDDFLGKVAELRKVFQQHVRDEKKELLPAVREALSKEEAEAVTAKITAEKEAAEAAQRREAEERRAAARREREETARREAEAKAKVEAKERRAGEAAKRERAEVRAEERRVREESERREAQAKARAEAKERQAREAAKREQAEICAEQRRIREDERQRQLEMESRERQARETAEKLAEARQNILHGGQSIALVGTAAAQAGADAAARASEHVSGLFGDAVEQSGTLLATVVQRYSDRTRPMMGGLQALANLPPVAIGAATETREAWLDWMGATAERRSRSSRDLMRCLTPFGVAEVQTRYLQQSIQAWFDANSRLLDISIEASRGLMGSGVHPAPHNRD